MRQTCHGERQWHLDLCFSFSGSKLPADGMVAAGRPGDFRHISWQLSY